MRGKIIVMLTFACIVIQPIYAQKKKKVLINKIESTTVISEDYEKNNGRSVKESYVRFDESGNILEEIEYDNTGKEKKHVVYEYDKDENKVKEIYYSPKGAKEKEIVYKYQDGLKIEKLTFGANGKLKSKKKYIYTFY